MANPTLTKSPQLTCPIKWAKQHYVPLVMHQEGQRKARLAIPWVGENMEQMGFFAVCMKVNCYNYFGKLHGTLG